MSLYASDGGYGMTEQAGVRGATFISHFGCKVRVSTAPEHISGGGAMLELSMPQAGDHRRIELYLSHGDHLNLIEALAEVR